MVKTLGIRISKLGSLNAICAGRGLLGEAPEWREQGVTGLLSSKSCLSVCVHTYICLYVSSHERVIEKLDFNFMTQLEVSKIFMGCAPVTQSKQTFWALLETEAWVAIILKLKTTSIFIKREHSKLCSIRKYYNSYYN